MEDVVYYTELYDIYGNLLTEKQKKYFEDYYFNNLSLGEMADSYSVSRNAIFKQIKVVNMKLQHYDDVLGLRFKYNQLIKVIDELDDTKIKNILSEIIK